MRAAAIAVAALLALSARQADAGRRAAPQPRVAGAKVKAWKASGTRFEHETLRMHGNVIHWERRATGKKGTTKVTGETWGSRYKGHEWRSGGKTLRKVKIQGSDGSTRRVFQVTDRSGASRVYVDGKRVTP
jgi:hypothetical protein